MWKATSVGGKVSVWYTVNETDSDDIHLFGTISVLVAFSKARRIMQIVCLFVTLLFQLKLQNSNQQQKQLLVVVST